MLIGSQLPAALVILGIPVVPVLHSFVHLVIATSESSCIAGIGLSLVIGDQLEVGAGPEPVLVEEAEPVVLLSLGSFKGVPGAK